MDRTTSRLVLRPDLAGVATARQFVGTQLRGHVASDVVADVELIASELVTNAVEHGASHDVTMTVSCDDDEVAVTVVSTGPSPGVGPVASWSLAARDAYSGRGLAIVRKIADRVDVRQTRQHLALTAHRHLVRRGSGLPSGAAG